MTKVDFSSIAIDTLFEGWKNHPQPKVRQKMHALYLKSIGLSNQDIYKICRINRVTLMNYLKSYATQGIVGLLQLKYKRRPNDLEEQKEFLCSKVTSYLETKNLEDVVFLPMPLILFLCFFIRVFVGTAIFDIQLFQSFSH